MHKPSIVVYTLAVASILILTAPAEAANVTAGSSCTKLNAEYVNNGPNNTTATCTCRKQAGSGNLVWQCTNFK